MESGSMLSKRTFSSSMTTMVRAWLTGFGLPVTILLAMRLAYFGALLPNTYNVKVGFGTPAVFVGLGYLWSFTVNGGFWLLLLAGAACAILFRPDKGAATTRLAILPPVAAIAAQVVFVILVGGDRFPGYRFVMPVYPLLCALAAIGLHATLQRVRRCSQLALAGASILICVGLAWSQSRGLESGGNPLSFGSPDTRSGRTQRSDDRLATSGNEVRSTSSKDRSPGAGERLPPVASRRRGPVFLAEPRVARD